MRYTILLLVILIVACCEPSETDNPMPVPGDTSSYKCNGADNTPLVLDAPSYFPTKPFPEGMTEAKFQLGKHLFYEKKLSRNNTISCGSCHKQSKAFTDGLPFSVGLNGETTRRGAMSIANLHWEDKFFWDARSPSLQDQALQPIQDHIEMDLTLPEAIARLEADTLYDSLFCKAYGSTIVDESKIAEAISIFEIALISADSKYDKMLKGETTLSPTEDFGRQLFATHPVFPTPRGGNCGDCHNPIMTNGFLGPSGMKNNGLDIEADQDDLGYEEVTGNTNDRAKFKTTTLKNIELTAPYMHDGRFNSLEEVLTHYNDSLRFSPTIDPLMFASNTPDPNSLKLGLLPFEKDAIIEFLRTLTDTSFVTNPRFSDPFE